MSVTKRRLHRVAAVALAAVTALGMTVACGKDEPAPGAKPTKLIVDTFGEFGYEDLVKLPAGDRHPGRAAQDREPRRLPQQARALPRHAAGCR
jgi:hypothetical protein